MDNYITFDPEEIYVININNGIRMACCDCGLVHSLHFETIEGDEPGLVAFSIEVDEEETKRVREGNPSLLERAKKYGTAI